MVRSAGLLRARHGCGLSSLRSLCRLMPAWISVNLCQAGPIKGNIYKALLCQSGFEKNEEVFCLFTLLDSSVGNLEANLAVLWLPFKMEEDVRELLMYGALDVCIVSYFALVRLISSL